jgi:hypothetical protein
VTFVAAAVMGPASRAVPFAASSSRARSTAALWTLVPSRRPGVAMALLGVKDPLSLLLPRRVQDRLTSNLIGRASSFDQDRYTGARVDDHAPAADDQAPPLGPV